jgi:hypothetical protein
VQKEYTKLNKLTGIIMVAEKVTAKAADLSQTDTVEGTYMDPLQIRMPQDLGATLPGTIKIFSNRTTSLEDGLALMEDKLNEQVLGLELGIMFTLHCTSTSPASPCLLTRTTGWRWPGVSSPSYAPGQTPPSWRPR